MGQAKSMPLPERLGLQRSDIWVHWPASAYEVTRITARQNRGRGETRCLGKL